MESVLLVVHLIVAIGIIALVLVQPAETGGFMGTGSMSNLMMPRRSGDVLTRLTTMMAAVFFATSLFLAVAASHRPVQKSILDDTGSAVPAAIKTTDDKAAPATGDATLKKDATDKATDKASDAKPAANGKPGKEADTVKKTEKTPTAPVTR